jgi:thiol-disulfide isomerase/thioredoxin
VLSVLQVGVTLVAIFADAVAGAIFAKAVAVLLSQIDQLPQPQQPFCKTGNRNGYVRVLTLIRNHPALAFHIFAGGGPQEATRRHADDMMKRSAMATKLGFKLTLALVALLLLAACSSGQEMASTGVEPAVAMAQADEEMASEEMTSDEMASDEMASDEMASDEMASDEMASDEMASDEMAAGEDAMSGHSDEAADDMMSGGSDMMGEEMAEPAVDAALATWSTLPLTNARTGETFTLADFAGQTVYVEPMATWCTNCRRQQGNVKDARAQLAGQDVVFVSLSVETTIDNATLAGYADGAGFDWLFAVMTPEMLQALASDFGQTIANPPTTPHLVIRPDGSATNLVTGIESAEQIVALIQGAQG